MGRLTKELLAGTSGAGIPLIGAFPTACCRRRRVRITSFRGISTALVFLNFWVKEAGQTSTTARHNTQNGQTCYDHHSPFKSTVHKGYNFPCSMIMTQIARCRCRRRRRISTPVASPSGRPNLRTGGSSHHVRSGAHSSISACWLQFCICQNVLGFFPLMIGWSTVPPTPTEVQSMLNLMGKCHRKKRNPKIFDPPPTLVWAVFLEQKLALHRPQR